VKPKVHVQLSCRGVEGQVTRAPSEGLMYCDASYADDMIVATGRDLDELIESFRDSVVSYFEWVKDKK